MADQEPLSASEDDAREPDPQEQESRARGTALGDGLHQAFPTPLLVKRFGDGDALNSRLISVIETRERQSPSVGMSNVKGWHSDGDLLEWPEPEIAELRRRVHGGLSFMLEKTRNPSRSFDMKTSVRAWANVARAGAYNAIHNHTPALFSGVYYVTLGDMPEPGSRSGLIEFVDPRPGPHGGPLPTHAFNQPLVVDPEPGMMLIFPSWLLHMVHPYDGVAPRMSIAFNLHIKDGGLSG